MSKVQAETPTIGEKLKTFFEDKLLNGYQIIDKESVIKLKKMGMTELKLARGNWSTATTTLDKLMEEKGIKISTTEVKKTANTIVKLIKTETSPPQPQQQMSSPFGTLPKPEGAISPESQITDQSKILTQTTFRLDSKGRPIIPISDDEVAKMERGLKKGFGLLIDLYGKIGAIEATDAKPKEKMTLADYKEETDALAHDWAIYCKDNDIRLPKLLETVLLGISTFVTLGSPLINMMVFGKNKNSKTKEEKLPEESSPSTKKTEVK